MIDFGLKSGFENILPRNILISSVARQILGTMNNVKMDEVKSPPITAIASGDQRSDASPHPTAIGKKPKRLERVVIVIGRKRSTPA